MESGYIYTAKIQIDKANIANQIIDGYTDGMTAINKIIDKKGKITYEIQGETSQITDLLKDLQRKGCKIGADIVIDTKDKELQKEIEKIKASIVADVIPNGDNFIENLQKQVNKQSSVNINITPNTDNFINDIQKEVDKNKIEVSIDKKHSKNNLYDNLYSISASDDIMRGDRAPKNKDGSYYKMKNLEDARFQELERVFWADISKGTISSINHIVDQADKVSKEIREEFIRRIKDNESFDTEFHTHPIRSIEGSIGWGHDLTFSDKDFSEKNILFDKQNNLNMAVMSNGMIRILKLREIEEKKALKIVEEYNKQLESYLGDTNEDHWSEQLGANVFDYTARSEKSLELLRKILIDNGYSTEQAEQLVFDFPIEDIKKFQTEIESTKNDASELSKVLTEINNNIKTISDNLEGLSKKSFSSTGINALDEDLKEVSENAQNVDQNLNELQNSNTKYNDYKEAIKLLQEYVDLQDTISKADYDILPYTTYDTDSGGYRKSRSRLINGSDTTKKSRYQNITQAALARKINAYDEGSSNIEELSAYTYALNDISKAEKVFGTKHKELFKEVQEYILNAEDSLKAYEKSEIDLSAGLSRLRNISDWGSWTFGDKNNFEKLLKNNGVESAIQFLVEKFGFEIPKAVQKTDEALSDINLKNEEKGMQNVDSATSDASDAKSVFKNINEEVAASASISAEKLEEEAKSFEHIRDAAKEASDSKSDFVDSNKGISNSTEPNETKVSSETTKQIIDNEEKKQKAKKETKQATEEEINAEKKYNLLKQQHFDSDEERKYNQNNAKNEAKAKYELLKQQHKDAEEERKYYNQIKKTEEQAAKVEAESKHNSRNKVKLNETEKLNSLLVRQKSIYKDISETEIQLAKLNLNPTENKNTIKATEDQLKNHKQLFVEITNEIKGLDAQFTSEQALKNVAEQRLETEKQINIIKSRNADSIGSNLLSKSNTMSNQLTTLLSKNWTGDFEARLKELQDRVTNFIGDLQEINPNNIETLAKKYKELSVEMFNVNQIEKNLAENKLASDLQLDKLSQQIADFTQKNGAMGRYFKNQFKEIADGIDAAYGKGSIEELKQFQSQILKLKSAVESANKTGDSFGRGLVNRIKSISQSAIAMAFSMYDVIRYAREAATVIHEYDDALTEMRKVSNENVQSLKNYQAASFDVADSIGTTALALQNSTADWMRLGESMEDAAESAKTATILMNVSEFESIDAATESLISASQAYQDLDKMDIVDVLNNIGNNYSVSTDQLAEGLQNAAAVLKTQNNELEESVALLTAGNAITQDMSKTSAGIRTIALRIAGTEEAKEELAD